MRLRYRQLFVLTSIVALGLGACSEPRWVTLEVTLDQDSVVAGTTLGYRAELVSDDGERRRATVELTSDIEPDLTFTRDDLTPIVAGAHLMTATATGSAAGLTGEAELQVSPGEPVSIDLSLSDETPEVSRPVTARARIPDIFGNETGAPWTISIVPGPATDAESVLIEGRILTFTQEGWYTVVGTVDDYGFEDRVGPFLIDSFPPELTLTHPPRGFFSDSFEDTVTGSVTDSWSSLESLTVNGAEVSVAYGGGFSQAVTYGFATNLVETVATDSDESTTTDRRAVLAGEFIPRGGGVGNGIVARVNQSTLDTIEAMAEELIASYDVSGMIPDPVFSDESEECLFGVCITLYELVLRARNLRYGPVDVELDPTAGGYLVASATVRDISVDWNASGVVAEIGYSASGTISADSIRVSMYLTPSVRDGVLHIDVSNVSVTSEGFVFDFDSWIYDAARFFGLDASGLIQDYMEEAIQDAVTDQVPPLLEETLRDLELGTDLDVFGVTYALMARPYDVGVDDDGLTLSLETFIDPSEWRAPSEGLGSLYAGYTPPSYGAEPGMIASFSADFLNQALYAFWGGGLLIQTVTAEEIGMDLSMLGLILEQLTELEVISINGLLPPVITPGEEGALFHLAIGDLEVLMYNGDPSEETMLLHFYAGFEADLAIEMTEEGALSPSISNISGWVDVTEPVLPNGFEIDTEGLLLSLVPLIEMQLGGALGEIPIPDISGFALTDITVEAAGAEGGFLNAAGDLTRL